MINHRLISNAIEYYSNIGYEYINVPWIVSREAILTTAPEWVRMFETFMGDLVASGEQGLIQMMMDGKLPPGKYVCATPCFRDEQILDELHQNYFYKVELINTKDVSVASLWSMIYDAAAFFESEGLNVDIDPVDDSGHLQYDLVYKQNFYRRDTYIEVGSYGIRYHNGLSWIYGTGCAEPRTSFAIKKQLDTIRENHL